MFRHLQRRKLHNVRNDRKGTATVELAVALPILLAFIFGGMEVSNGIFLKQGLTIAAYETAKMATTVGFTSNEALTRGQQLLTARGFSDATITITPPNTSSLAPGTPVTVSVSAPADSNAISPVVLFSGSTVNTQIVMRRN